MSTLVKSWDKYLKLWQGLQLHHLQNLISKLESSSPNACYIRRVRDEDKAETERWKTFADWVKVRVEPSSVLKLQPDSSTRPFIYVSMAD